MKKNIVKKVVTNATVDQFLKKSNSVAFPNSAKKNKSGRLIFSLDATASRQPTWDTAAQIQSEMFLQTSNLGALDIQLNFYRGFGEFLASRWINNPYELMRIMGKVTCSAGETQVCKVLKHAVKTAKLNEVDALVFVGDCFEEDVDNAGKIAGELGLLGVPVFIFHEGHDPIAEFSFKQICKLSGGAYCRFDQSSADTLKNLLSAVAIYVVGGSIALKNYANKKGGKILFIADQVN